ncbi:MAG: hypothetical protein GWP66_04980 [Gammaproteobacteria bacterium]|jgi:hypothetical protein|nr:hypothetical protein [Gammaproteobacteria bacterium]
MRTLLLVLMVWGLAVPALAESRATEKPQAGSGSMLFSEPGRAELTEMVAVSARVEGVDPESRTLTLKTADGQMVEYVAGEEVRNFAQVEVGDMVEASILKSLRLELVEEGADAEPTGVGAMARAGEGAKPGAAVGSEVTFMTEVVRVDQPANIISLKGPEGNVVDFDVQNPAQFDVVKVGDKVRATYTEAVAVEVRSAQ